jgi:hypothetical protein
MDDKQHLLESMELRGCRSSTVTVVSTAFEKQKEGTKLNLRTQALFSHAVDSSITLYMEIN